MKLVRYQLMGRDAPEEYLITEAEFEVAFAAWKAGDDFYCIRLKAVLPRPKVPTITPVRFQEFEMYSDPERPWKEFALLDDGRFHEFDLSQSKPYDSLVADEQVVSRLQRFESLGTPEAMLGLTSSGQSYAPRLQGSR